MSAAFESNSELSSVFEGFMEDEIGDNTFDISVEDVSVTSNQEKINCPLMTY